MKHIVVEGPDASGKDGLIARLMLVPKLKEKFRIHPRASTSLGGPIKNLAGWVGWDLEHLRHTDVQYLYNRHPLISERIYAPIREVNRGYVPMFGDKAWVLRHQRMLAVHALLIIVQPPFTVVDEIMHQQGPDAHMPGVFNNRLVIYNAYKDLVWPGITIRYNRIQTSFESLVQKISLVLGDSQ